MALSFQFLLTLGAIGITINTLHPTQELDMSAF